MEAICLDVMVQQVSSGGGGFQNISPGKKKKKEKKENKKTTPQAQYQECPPHTAPQSAHTSQQTRVYPYPGPRPRCSVCFELGEGRPLKQKEKERGGWEEEPRPPWPHRSMIVFVRMSQG